MEWNLLHSLIYGFVSAFTELLPISSEAHQWLFLKMTGAGDEYVGFRLLCHVAVLLALLLSCKSHIARISRSAKAYSRRNKRYIDTKSLLDLKVFKIAAVPLCLSILVYLKVGQVFQESWWIGVICFVNGIILFIPEFLPRGNKESNAMSSMDALLIGLGGMLAVVPGISRTAALTSVIRARGGECKYALDMSFLLSIPVLIILTLLDCYLLVSGVGFLTWHYFLQYIVAGLAAFGGAYFGIILVRFLAIKASFSGFAYYSWGAALFIFILYIAL